MRISDWSSDVCSSDLPEHADAGDQRDDAGPVGPALLRQVDGGQVERRFHGAGRCHGSVVPGYPNRVGRSEEHTSELQSLMRISYAVFFLKKKKNNTHKCKNKNQRITN